MAGITTTSEITYSSGKLPANKKIYFDLNSMGLDKISTSISLNYDATHSIVGLATDGDYYVIGGGK